MGGALVLLVVGGYFGASWYAARMVRGKLLPAAAKKLGRSLTVAEVDTGWGWVTLRGVALRGTGDGEPVAQLKKVRLEYGVWAAVRGRLEVTSIVADGAAIKVRREADGSDNFSDLVDRLRGRGPGAVKGGGRTAKLLNPVRVTLHKASFEFVDAQHGASMRIAELSAEGMRGLHMQLRMKGAVIDSGVGPSAKVAALTLDSDLSAGSYRPAGSPRVKVEGGELAVLPSLALTGIAGTVQRGAGAGEVAPDGGKDRFELDLTGGWGGVEGKLWQAKGWVLPRTREGELALKAERFELGRLAPLVAGSPVKDADKTTIRADLALRLKQGKLGFDGSLDFTGLTVFHKRLSAEPLRDLAAETQVRGAVDLATRSLQIDDALARIKGIEVRLQGSAARPVGTPWRVNAHVTVPQRPCQDVLVALPKQFVPSLQGFGLKGNFSADIELAIDKADLQKTVLDGKVGINGCKVLTAPEALSMERFKRSFSHDAEIRPGVWRTFAVGPSNPDFVSIDKINPNIINSLMTTEDSGFYRHRGFITREFRSALISNLERGYFRVGASSITMQMVKNTMMTRDKTLSRKFQELFLTWYTEQELTKDRIMEIYLNVIEFGPEIYGIGPAMRHYFGREPADATPLQAAFFSSILPNPKQRYVHRCAAELDAPWSAYLRRIISKMHERDRLPDEEYAAGMAATLVFNPDTLGESEAECRRRSKKAVEAVAAARKEAAGKSVRPAPGVAPEDPPEPDEEPGEDDLAPPPGDDEPQPWD